MLYVLRQYVCVVWCIYVSQLLRIHNLTCSGNNLTCIQYTVRYFLLLVLPLYVDSITYIFFYVCFVKCNRLVTCPGKVYALTRVTCIYGGVYANISKAWPTLCFCCLCFLCKCKHYYFRKGVCILWEYHTAFGVHVTPFEKSMYKDAGHCELIHDTNELLFLIFCCACVLRMWCLPGKVYIPARTSKYMSVSFRRLYGKVLQSRHVVYDEKSRSTLLHITFPMYVTVIYALHKTQ